MGLTVGGLLAYTAPIFSRENILKDENRGIAMGKQVLGCLKDSQTSKSHNQTDIHSANHGKLLPPAVQVLQVWVSVGLISLWGPLPLSVSFSRFNNRQLWQMEPYPHRSREAPDLKCKRAGSDWEEEEAMSQGSRRQGRLP
ncbi:hypothetical protein QQF64_014716 [Cirrhinus molitorella]|uniref:Uncharacterized protein n=1 Tax=Cirrhinus molitorella TaxID=172907 RepID=A0ABR3NU40_9TELE